MTNTTNPTPRPRGRPPRYLLSSIAVCGVCDAPTRVGTQNTHTAQPSADDQDVSKYRVYECPGLPGRNGFHVSIRQDSLDEFVTNAVLAHVTETGFVTPRSHNKDASDAECRALRAMIKSDRAWLKIVHKDAARWNRPDIPGMMEEIVLPKIESALKRIDELEARDAVILELSRSLSPGEYWCGLELFEQRRIVGTLVIPRIRPVDASHRGRRGLNTDRIELTWRH